MPYFKKKPVVVEAHRYNGSSSMHKAFADWIAGGEFKAPAVQTRDMTPMFIDTLEGVMTASPGDYIIKGVEGEFYPCKPGIFAATMSSALTQPGEPTGKRVLARAASSRAVLASPRK